MKASIVIIAHNEEKHIADAIRAALDQDFDGTYEVIVVINACKPTDRTREIALTFPAVRVVDEPQKGILYAREAGRKAARGEVIAQQDADCTPSRHWLADGLKPFDDPRVVCVSGSYDYYDAKPSFRCASHAFQSYAFWMAHHVVVFLGIGCIGTGGNMFVRRKALGEIGGYDVTILFYREDTNTARRLMGVGKVLYVPEILVKSSARRFEDEGAMKVFRDYTYYWVKELMTTRPHKPRKKANR